MMKRLRARTALVWLAAGTGLGLTAYAAYVGRAWTRYGCAPSAGAGDEDRLLDRFMPAYEVVERHQARVAAPAAILFAASREMDLLQLPLVRAIFRARELILGASPDGRPQPCGLLADVQSLGWVVLADSAGREVVVGAATRPWEPNVTFRGIPPEDFASFAEPGYVKIAWTLRADPDGPTASIFRTETRAIATDSAARARFRRYWACVSPGIRLIRWLSLRPLAHEAARRANRAVTGGRDVPAGVAG